MSSGERDPAQRQALPPSRLRMPVLLTVALILVLGALAAWLWARERDKRREEARKADVIGRCKSGEAQTCLAAGERLESRGLARRAERAYQRCCDARQASCCFNVGLLRWRRGDRAGAAPLLRRACDRGHARGCTNLGALLLEQGKARAGIEASRRACKRSQALGCRNLAFALLMDGDKAKARAPALEACKQGSALGCLLRCHLRLLEPGASSNEGLRCYRKLLERDRARRALSKREIVAELKRLSSVRATYREALAGAITALSR